jgi:hypothetical protein
MMISLKTLIENTGLDWFAIFFNRDLIKPRFENLSSLSEVREKISDLSDKEKLDEAMDYCKGLLEREEKRSDKIESKAFTLIGFTSIPVASLTAFLGFLLESSSMPPAVNMMIVVFYVVLVVALLFTIFLASRVVTVLDYAFTYPNPKDILLLSDASLAYVRIEYIASVYYSFIRNQEIDNVKATFLGGAQLWFKNSIFLLLAFTLFLGGYMISDRFLIPAFETIFSIDLNSHTQTNSPVVTPTPKNFPLYLPTVEPAIINSVSPIATMTPIP